MFPWFLHEGKTAYLKSEEIEKALRIAALRAERDELFRLGRDQKNRR